jgi:xylan 1,4-beta-xylosidase
MKKFLYLLLLCAHSSVFAQIKFMNPILSGFYPDPSVTKVGQDYYLVNSTFAYFPGIPVFHSRDLKNWKQIGNVIDRDSQMNFMGDGTSRGLFAPSINYNKGTFYMTCTLIDRKGNFVMTAKNPAGPWSDPIWLPEVKGIDPSLFFDEDRAYVVYNSDPPENKSLYPGHRTIRTFEFDPATLKVKGKEKILVNGGVDISKKPVWIEGPHIFKRGNWYYICAAEGGTSVNHSQVVLRSNYATGPYIPYEKNPILTQRDLDPKRPFPITSTGHAELVEGPDGQTYAIFLAVRPYEGNFYNTGRETFIAPVRWTEGWPVINPDSKEVLYEYTANFAEQKAPDIRPQSGDFAYRTELKKPLDPSLLFLRKNDSSSYTLTAAKGLTMKLKAETCMEKGNPSFLGKRQQHMNSSAVTPLDFNPAAENEKAGLMIFQGEYNFYFMCKSLNKGKTVIQLYKGNKANSSMDLVKQDILHNPKGKLELKIDAKAALYDFKFKEQGKAWKTLQENVDGKYLSTQTAGGFIGCLFALYATSSGKPSTNTASYQWIDYNGDDSNYKPAR